MKSLLNVPGGGQARLASASGQLLHKLRQYGLHAGDELREIRTAPLGSPMLVAVKGRELLLGRAVAEKSSVETECELR